MEYRIKKILKTALMTFLPFTCYWSLATVSTLFTVFSLVTVFSVNWCYGASWPVFRGDTKRTGMIYEQAKPVLAPEWQFRTTGKYVSSPIVYKGVVYSAGRDGCIRALDAYTGDQLWRSTTENWIDATPCISSDVIIVPSLDQNVYAFYLVDGSIKWKTNTGSSDCSSPVLYNGKIYLLSGPPKNQLYCLNANTGVMENSYPVRQFSFSSPSIKGNLMFFGTNDGYFNCLDLNSGNVIWTKPTRGGIFYSTIAVGDDYIYALSGGDERKLFCLNPNDGSVVWESVEIGNKTSSVSSVTLTKDKIFLVSSIIKDLKIFAFPLTSETVSVSPLWSRSIGNPHESGIISSPCVANDVIYIGSGDGKLYCLNASNGQFIDPLTGSYTDTQTGYSLSYEYSYSSGCISSPCVSNGWVYAGTYEGNLLAFKASEITSIFSPDNYETIINSTTIVGTVSNPSQLPYVLEYSSGENSGLWTSISTNTAAVENNIIFQWNASGIPDGLYSLRLTVNNDFSRRAINKVIIDNPPQAPSNLTCIDTPLDNGGSLTLNWTKSPDDGTGNGDIAGYKIYKSSDGLEYAYYVQTSSGTSAFIDSACPVYQQFYYKVSAVDRYNESNLSNYVGSYSELDGIQVDPFSTVESSITLTYNGLTTEVVITSGTFDTAVWIGIKISSSNINVTLPSNVRGTNIVREFTILPSSAVFKLPVTIRIPYMTSDIQGLNEENLRIFRWHSVEGEWQLIANSEVNLVKKYVKADISSFSFYRVMEYTPPPPNNVPGAPSNLLATDTVFDEGGSITLTWQRSADDGNGDNDVVLYKIYRSTSSSAEFTYFAEVSSGTSVFVDSACPVYNTFYYKLTAWDSITGSQYSNEAHAYSEMDGALVNAALGRTISLVVNESTTTVLIEPEGLSNDARVGIKIPSAIQELKIPNSAKPVSVFREFTISPSSTSFLKNIVVKIPYKDSETLNMEKKNIRIYWADTSKNSWRIVNTSNAEIENGRIWASIPHFSYYRLMEYLPGVDELISKETVYTYPNPAKGDVVYFKFYLGSSADVEINVYNVAGELVVNLKKDLCPAGLYSEIEWNISGIASGVYIYRVQAKSFGEIRSIKKKLAIIH